MRPWGGTGPQTSWFKASQERKKQKLPSSGKVESGITPLLVVVDATCTGVRLLLAEFNATWILVSNREAEASSKTYRHAINVLADELDIEPDHSGRPSQDYLRAVELLGDKLREHARKYYRLGIRRGLIVACDRMLEGELVLEGDTLRLPNTGVTVKVKVRYAPEDDKKSDSFKFTPSQLEFDPDPGQ